MLPQHPFHLNPTLIPTVLKNGAVLEIAYAGALGVEPARQSFWGGIREETKSN